MNLLKNETEHPYSWEFRRKIFFYFLIITLISIAIFSISNIVLKNYHLLFVDLIVGTANALILFYFVKSKNFNRASTLYLLTFFLTAGYLFLTGGDKEAGIFWSFVFPLLAAFLRPYKEAIIWNLLYTSFVIMSGIFYFIKYIRLPYPLPILRSAILVYFIISVLSILFTKMTTNLVRDYHELAIKDPLTGLYNRNFAISYLLHEVEKVKRDENKNLCLVYLDLDRFKLVNDRFGHKKGDEVLREVTKILLKYFRKSDIVARIGGDEFIAILSNCDAEAVKKRLLELRKHIEDAFSKFKISVSFGIALVPEDSYDSTELLKIADRRMYINKMERRISLPES